ncbi:MAG: hypothetical protein M1153_02855 [Patescibacteria group bacterium]|nr:hypothetical protein [Patescibacteria group bacterium]
MRAEEPTGSEDQLIAAILRLETVKLACYRGHEVLKASATETGIALADKLVQEVNFALWGESSVPASSYRSTAGVSNCKTGF